MSFSASSVVGATPVVISTARPEGFVYTTWYKPLGVDWWSIDQSGLNSGAVSATLWLVTELPGAGCAAANDGEAMRAVITNMGTSRMAARAPVTAPLTP